MLATKKRVDAKENQDNSYCTAFVSACLLSLLCFTLYILTTLLTFYIYTADCRELCCSAIGFALRCVGRIVICATLSSAWSHLNLTSLHTLQWVHYITSRFFRHFLTLVSGFKFCRCPLCIVSSITLLCNYSVDGLMTPSELINGLFQLKNWSAAQFCCYYETDQIRSDTL